MADNFCEILTKSRQAGFAKAVECGVASCGDVPFFDGIPAAINAALEVVLTATEAAKWLPIDQAPPGDDIDLIGLFEVVEEKFTAIFWRCDGHWVWPSFGSITRCPTPVKFQYPPEPPKGDA